MSGAEKFCNPFDKLGVIAVEKAKVTPEKGDPIDLGAILGNVDPESQKAIHLATIKRYIGNTKVDVVFGEQLLSAVSSAKFMKIEK